MIPSRLAPLFVLLGALLLLPSIATAGSAPVAATTPSPTSGLQNPSLAPSPAPVQGTIVGAPAGVNIRACPKADCSVVGIAKFGERLLVTGPAKDGFVPVERGGVAGYAFALYVATAEGGTPELRQGLPGCNRVAFIFNVGVGFENRIEILDRLKADGIPATVFPMGWWADEHPDLLQRIAQGGFPIGSHGAERVKLTDRGDEAVKADIRAAAATIERAIGKPPEPYFTPYAAETDERVNGLIARAGYLPVGYTLPAGDWDYGADPDRVWENVVPKVQDGAIVEFHLDAPASAESTGVALPWIVERLRAKGYRFVTIAEMARPCA